MQFTGEKPWNPIMLDCYPQPGGTAKAPLYEDDTRTTAYQRGEFRKTSISLSADASSGMVRVVIGAADGVFSGALKERSWVVRIHLPSEWPKNLLPSTIRLNGRETGGLFRKINQSAAAMPLGDVSGAPDAEVFEVDLPAAPVSRSQTLEIVFAASQ
jgi:hypothetical protein